MSETFLKVMTNTRPQVKEAQDKYQNPTPGHIILKLWKTKEKLKILKETKEVVRGWQGSYLYRNEENNYRQLCIGKHASKKQLSEIFKICWKEI